MQEKDIVFEAQGGKAWVYDDKKKSCYTVFLVGATHSVSDSSYPRHPDGLSIAKARAKYLDKRITLKSSQVS